MGIYNHCLTTMAEESKTKGNKLFWVTPAETRPPAREPIDWECPCLSDVRQGPCADAFRSAFECAHYAENDVARLECKPRMEIMADCVRANREQYSSYASMLDEMDRDVAAAQPRPM